MYAYYYSSGRPEKPPSPRPDPGPVGEPGPQGEQNGCSIF